MNFLTSINLNGNELQNIVIQNLAIDPTNPKQGQFWFNTAEGVLKYYNTNNEIKIVGNGTLTEADVAELRETVSELESLITNEENGLDAIIAKIDEALATANEAKTTATTASNDASTAKSDAANAVSTANNASTTAAAATSTATAAQTTANEAKSESASALEKATSAESIANEAKATAESANTAAGNAQTTADSAQAAAEAAQTTADGKITKVTGVEDNIVLFAANGEIKDSGKKLSDIETGGSEEVDTSGLISKVSGAVAGNIAVLTEDGSIRDSSFSITSKLNTEATAEVPTSNAINSYIESRLSNITQGVIFRGILTSSEPITTPYNVGDMYYIGEAGTYVGQECEIGDVLIAKEAKTESESIVDSDWSVLESNKDVFKGGGAGLVPAAPTDGTTGYLDNTGNWTAPVAKRWSGLNSVITADLSSGSATWNIQHGLGRMDVQVIVYKVDSMTGYYTQIMAEVVLVGKNNCKIVFSTSTDITENTYYAVVM